MNRSLCLLAVSLLLSSCASQTRSDHNAVTLQTGHPVVDAASHLATGLYLENKTKTPAVAPDDPQVKALNDAIQRAKSRQLMQQAGQKPEQQDDQQ